jgi:Tfp pilus assembly protein PilV
MAPAGDALDDDGLARTPGRRAGDFVNYREMVEYYSSQSEREHTDRAQMAMQWSNAFERLEASLKAMITAIVTRFDDHETWHRNVMQGLLERQPAADVAKSSNRMQAVMLTIAGCALLVSVVTLISLFVR